MTRTITIDALSRVEGEGGLVIRFKGDEPVSVELNIYEPPRFFEGFLRGRSALEAPDLTARICGICPVAYQMSACHAVEAALGVVVSPEIKALRRLLYAGEWIGSHALHVFLLHAPDFLGCKDVVELAKLSPVLVQDGLAVKKAGNAIVQALGGREIHPVNVRVGGFYRAPQRAELERLIPTLEGALAAMERQLPALAALRFPEARRDVEYVALADAERYPFCDGPLTSTEGLSITAAEYEAHFEEHQVPRSTALHSRLRERGNYVCGPLARFNLNFDVLRPKVQQLARSLGLAAPVFNPYQSILVRALEVVQCLDEALATIRTYRAPERPAEVVTLRAGTGAACTEAPRGTLYHRYTLDDAGTIVDAKIVPPTSQNQASIEDDLFAQARELATLPPDAARSRAEQAVRNYDPCISCSTHFLKLELVREP